MSVAQRKGYQPPGSHDDGRIFFGPVWPLLAVMLAGVWLAYPWAIINTILLDTEERTKQLTTLIGTLVAILLISLLLVEATESGLLDIQIFRYLWIGVVVLKLWAPYQVFLEQHREVQLREYFGAKVRSGVAIFIVGVFARSAVLGAINMIWLKMALS